MPLPDCIHPKDIITKEISAQPRTEEEIVGLVRSVITKRDWPMTKVVYVVDISFHDCNRNDSDDERDPGSETKDTIDTNTEPIAKKKNKKKKRSRFPWNDTTLLDYRRYEVVFLEDGSTKLLNYSHRITTGDFTHTVLEVANKPKLNVRELIIPIKGVKYIKDQGEHQIRLRLKDIYNKAIQDLGAQGFPQFDSIQQSYHLRIDYYYLDQLIKKQGLSWNPHQRISDTDAMGADEHVEMLKNRPDHVRLADVRLEYVSLFWLQEWINKIMDERLS